MGRYCKAYHISNFRNYKHWKEKAENTQLEKKEIDGNETEVPRELKEGDFLYLHENYIVTDGIYLDENIIFDEVTDEWKEFCDNTLKFEVPNFETESIKESEKKEEPEKKEE